jgi:putative aldouronate transport system substrate-binding protein
MTRGKARSLWQRLAVVAAFAVLAALSATAGPQAERASAAPVKVTYFMGLPTQTAASLKSLGEVYCWQELQRRTGVTIEFVHPAVGQDREQFNLIMASRDFPDIMVWNWGGGYPGGGLKAVDDGVIIKLNPYLSKMPYLMAALNSKPEDYKKPAFTDDGTLYMFPGIREKLGDTSFGLMMRGDWLKKLNLPVPETIADWDKTLRAFKTLGPDVIPLTIEGKVTPPVTGNNAFQALAGAWGIYPHFYYESGKARFGALQPEYREFLSGLRGWYADKLLDNDFMANDRKAVDVKATQGKAGALPGQQSTQLGNYNQLVRKTDPSFGMIAVPFPKANKDGPKPTAWFEAVVNTSGAAITTTSKKVDAALKVCDYPYSPEGHLLINFGKEGESYTMVNGRPMFTDLIKKNPNGLGLAQAIARYGMMSASGPFVKSREWSYQKADDPVLLDALNVWMSSGVNKALPEGLSPTSDESKKLATIMGRVNTYMDEMFVKFVTGAESLANYPAFVDNLRKLGIDEAVSIQQAAVDRWAKR